MNRPVEAGLLDAMDILTCSLLCFVASESLAVVSSHLFFLHLLLKALQNSS